MAAAVLREYEVSETSLLLTKCPFYDCLIGGWHCANCVHFQGKNMEEKTVNCLKKTPSLGVVGGLPPMREPRSKTN